MLSSAALSPFLAMLLMAAQGNLPDPAPDARRDFAPAVIVSAPIEAPASPRAPVPSEVKERERKKAAPKAQ
ncbi:hypothetical protein SAMN05660686_02599 [Thalassobaculum litoreum DSM 18839]|uniref:Uncharacterized protein n=1 Tax=Thalassobaculum litoreum DSM 18839 TaxID=1123362 RepID=A0A8G2EZ06_9PROT|nr:hypothetical protein SAMN05660686_02599 [Thalassobaculum litoreum DSM 18839]